MFRIYYKMQLYSISDMNLH